MNNEQLIRAVLKKLGHHPDLISSAEQTAIVSMLDAAEQFGYGNFIAWLQTAWAAKLHEEDGMTKNKAVAFVSNRSPYPLP